MSLSKAPVPFWQVPSLGYKRKADDTAQRSASVPWHNFSGSAWVDLGAVQNHFQWIVGLSNFEKKGIPTCHHYLLPSVLLLHKVRHFCLRQQVDDWKSGHGMVMEHSASCKIRAAVEHDRHFCSMNLEACEARQQASRPYAERPWWVDNGPKSHDT